MKYSNINKAKELRENGQIVSRTYCINPEAHWVPWAPNQLPGQTETGKNGTTGTIQGFICFLHVCDLGCQYYLKSFVVHVYVYVCVCHHWCFDLHFMSRFCRKPHS